MSQDINSIYNNQLYFYRPVTNNWQLKLENTLCSTKHMKCIKDTFNKTCAKSMH